MRRCCPSVCLSVSLFVHLLPLLCSSSRGHRNDIISVLYVFPVNPPPLKFMHVYAAKQPTPYVYSHVENLPPGEKLPILWNLWMQWGWLTHGVHKHATYSSNNVSNRSWQTQKDKTEPLCLTVHLSVELRSCVDICLLLHQRQVVVADDDRTIANQEWERRKCVWCPWTLDKRCFHDI